MSFVFDSKYYLQQNPDVLTAVLNGTMPSAEHHFNNHGWRELRNPNANFDVHYYFTENPDVAAAGMNPLHHFQNHGASEGRTPSAAYADAAANFPTDAYLNANADVKAAVDAGIMTAYQHWVLYGQFENRPSAPNVDVPGANAGQTFTLTTGIDNLVGTSANDTFIGDAATTSAADQVVGGAGTDTLKLFGTNTVAPAYSGIENIELIGRNATAFDTSSKADVKSVTVDGATGGASTITVGSGQSVTLKNSTVGTNIATTATNASLAVTVDAITGNALVDFAGAALATVDLNVASNSAIQISNDQVLATLNISGAGNLTLDADTAGTLLTTVNAASATGNLTIALDDSGNAKNVTVVTGKGNDTVNFGAALTKDDKFDGGEGRDTLEITQASVTTIQGLSTANKAIFNGNLTNVEVLKVTDALTSDIDASRFANINSFVLAAGINPGGTSTLSKVTSGVSVELGDAAGNPARVLAIEIIDASLAGNNSDEVNLILNDNGAAGASDLGVVNLAGVDILNIEAKQTAAGTTTGYVLDIANTSTALDKVVVTGNLGVDISTVALTNTIQEIDASGMTVAATANGLSVAVATGGSNGVKITGSGGVDTIVGGDGADVIISGAGNDTITGGKGNDVIDISGGGSNTLIFADTAANNGNDTITGFNAGLTASGGDVLNFNAFLGGAGALNAILTANPLATDVENDINLLVDIAGGQDITTAAGLQTALAGGGEYANVNMANSSKAVFITAADSDVGTQYIFFAESDGAGAITVTLVGTLAGVDIDNFIAANFVL